MRECLRIREKNMPGDWQAFAAKAMLAETMIGEKHYAEAEPLLLNAYEALKAQEKLIPAPQKDCLLDAAQTLVHLYESSGKPQEAERWRRKE